MKTFCVHTLGCKVNHYEAEQIAALLRARGLVEAQASHADLRVVHTCSVTVQAASKSRQATRRLVRLPLLQSPTDDVLTERDSRSTSASPRVVVTGCWASSDGEAARAMSGVDAVISHGSDVAAELERLLDTWREEGGADRRQGLPFPLAHADSNTTTAEPLPEGFGNDKWMNGARTPAGTGTRESKAGPPRKVNLQIYARSVEARPKKAPGTTGLPLLGGRQTGRQRALLKVQDGCDAHCTYCIIPRLRPAPWSKPVDEAVEEARRLVDSGHVEVVLTGVFLGAFGYETALRRRRRPAGAGPLGRLVEALCGSVPGLRRLRLSSLEPGDLTDDLVAVLRGHRQVVPHFHLPLQSGSDRLLRRMNRQYGRDDFLLMVDRVRDAFDRPALTTDVIVGFPGEDDEEFRRTVEVVDRSAFIHVHAFSFSPRPGTAAARWAPHFVHGPVVNERIELLRRRAADHSLAFRRQFVGETVEVLVEDDDPSCVPPHGRCERYFDVRLTGAAARPGDFARVRVDEVRGGDTFGTCLSVERPDGGRA